MLPSCAEIECRGSPGQGSTESELLLQQIGGWYKSACETALALVFVEEDKERQTRDEAEQEHFSFHEQGISILSRLFSLSASLLSKPAPAVFPLLVPVLACMHPTPAQERTCTDFSVIDFMLMGSYQMPEHEGENINPDNGPGSPFSSYSEYQLNMSEAESQGLDVKLWQLLRKFKCPASSSASGLSDHLRCHVLLEGLHYACSISAASSANDTAGLVVAGIEAVLGIPDASIRSGCVLDTPEARTVLETMRTALQLACRHGRDQQVVPVGLEARLLSLLNTIAGQQLPNMCISET
uniref:Uncharacterized protein n=1 Tax=Cryptomonas curvata TaxID=233186 RepID=A0A7S0QB41_9CRYP